MAESAAKVFLYANGKDLTYGIKRYIIDDESGLSALPKDLHVGSSCLIVNTGDIYVMNSQGEWKKSPRHSSSGGEGSGGGSEWLPIDDEVEYDGGEVI